MKRENIVNVCRIPFLKADAEATRLQRRVAQCTHTNTEMQTCTQTYKDTHTHTQKRHASTSGSMPVYLPMGLFIELKTFCKQKRQPKASVEKREKCTAFYMRLFSQSLPLLPCFWWEKVIEEDRQICFCSWKFMLGNDCAILSLGFGNGGDLGLSK